MRVMVDANVLLSALVLRSQNALRVIEHASSDGNELVLSTWVLGEVRRVVALKWPSRTQSLESLLLAMRYELVVTPPDDEIEWGLFEIRDPMDYPVLYSAVFADVDVFVTGDRDFAGVDVGSPAVLTPVDYVRAFCFSTNKNR